ncbi:uncharacterized protein LOC124170865 isoform X1 [Ischnura elegans]|uniref:uncharacterized protein LOC124170865 isoform X1 n=1 Tax=Ischnura elegans TaxID=197161 RepID=UPI001ED871BB|nr:uncharacterized protein LOC124170865 isoform X1 [Ischnura elegans]
MPVCDKCGAEISTIRGLFAHYTFAHPIADHYRCAENGCFRVFHSRNSFRKHLQKVHKFLLEPTEIGDQIHNGLVVDQDDGDYEDMPNLSNNASHDTAPQTKTFSQDFINSLFFCADAFVSKLYSNPCLPRNHIQTIIEDVETFLGGGFLELLRTKVTNSLRLSNCDEGETEEVLKMFQALESPFKHLSTEHHRLKHFKNTGNYIPPESYLIGHTFCSKASKTGGRGENVEVTGQFVPLRKTLKKFFELPNALNDTLKYMKSLKSDSSSLQNFIQGKLWAKKIVQYAENDIVIPLFIYFDDFEVNNPLGPHSGKLGAVYATIPCLPQECQSLLRNHFLVLLFDSWSRSHYGNKQAFQPLLDELLYLETNGIEISNVDEFKHVYFVLGLVLGDNLGLNSVLGMVESFNANYFCRLCKLSKSQSEKQTTDLPHMLRSQKEYDDDVKLNDCSKTGVKEDCVWHYVQSFHITSNFFVDEMHDMREGICSYDMIHILRGIVDGPSKDLDLETLNIRLKLFDYGPIDSSNKPPLISRHSLKKGNKLAMTSSEMLCFVRLLGVIIGDLVSENNPYWELYVVLRQIIEILVAKRVPKDIVGLLRVLIEEHHALYLRLTGDTLKPKHHLLTHYPLIFEESGPVGNLSCIRFEAKHRDSTRAASVNMSRRNISHTLAVKHQLSMCYRLAANEGILPKPLHGPCDMLEVNGLVEWYHTLPASLRDRKVLSPSWIEYKGTKYKPGMVLVTGAKDLCPTFAEIRFILIDDMPNFICVELKNLGLNEHVLGYEVIHSSEWVCIGMNQLLDPLPLYAFTMANGEKYVVLRYAI